jgi:hypothetical protein
MSRNRDHPTLPLEHVVREIGNTLGKDRDRNVIGAVSTGIEDEIKLFFSARAFTALLIFATIPSRILVAWS